MPSFAKNIKFCFSFAKFMELCQVMPSFAKFMELCQVMRSFAKNME
jgi:hypothetical protein